MKCTSTTVMLYLALWAMWRYLHRTCSVTVGSSTLLVSFHNSTVGFGTGHDLWLWCTSWQRHQWHFLQWSFCPVHQHTPRWFIPWWDAPVSILAMFLGMSLMLPYSSHPVEYVFLESFVSVALSSFSGRSFCHQFKGHWRTSESYILFLVWSKTVVAAQMTLWCINPRLDFSWEYQFEMLLLTCHSTYLTVPFNQ